MELLLALIISFGLSTKSPAEKRGVKFKATYHKTSTVGHHNARRGGSGYIEDVE